MMFVVVPGMVLTGSRLDVDSVPESNVVSEERSGREREQSFGGVFVSKFSASA